MKKLLSVDSRTTKRTTIRRALNTSLNLESLETRTLMANNFLAGTAFVDSNSNGQLDTTESYLPGATIELRTSSGSLLQTATTDSKGAYLFSGLSPGDYKLVNLSTSGYAATSTQSLSQISQDTGSTSSTINVTLADPADLQASIDVNAYFSSGLNRDLNYTIFGTSIVASGGQLPTKLYSASFSPNPTSEFLALCIDLYNDLTVGVNGPFVVTPDSIPIGNGSPHNAERVAYLYNHYGQFPQGSNGAAAVQMAVWELLYDAGISDPDGDLGSGNFRIDAVFPGSESAAVLAQANLLLAESVGKAESAIFLNVPPPTPGTPGTVTNRQGVIVSGSFNFGNKPLASLGDVVWHDLNANGKQDNLNQIGGEPGIPGVTVTLTDSSGNPVLNVFGAPVAPQVTNATGGYLFSNLVAGTYKVAFSNLPSGYVFTTQDVSLNGFDAIDSDANATTGMTGTYTLVSGDSNLTVDAGAYLPASLGNFVWNDLNGNGKQELGEPGIDGVTATLTGTNGLGVAVNLSQVTAGGGAYLFSNLVPGDYKVTFSNLPAGYVFTAQNVGANGFDTVDSDADTTTGMTGTYTLVSGDSNLTVDAGAYLPASLGNFVWNDLNGNGKQELGEPGIDGVTATLTGTNGLGVAVNLSQVTAGGGAYLFSNLVPGDYKVTFSNLPAGYVFTAQNVGANGFDTVDSDADTTTGMTGTYTLVSGDSNLTVDAGAYLPASLGNFVWNDLNGNGKQELGEPGIDGVTATLTGTNGLGVAVNLSQVTAGGGAYLFSNLVPGDYKVTFSNLPAGYVFTAQNVGANGFDTVDSDADTTTGMTGTYTLVSGDSNLTVDAGAYLPASLGNFVWNDLNGNGKQELGEPGIDGVTATLTGTNGLGVAVNLSQVTAGGGAYLFSNLVPGDYKVTFSNLPAGYVFTAQNVGANGFDTVDSDADTTTGMTGTYTLVSGDSNLTVDAGAYLPASLGNFVWNDLNGNGKQELGEPGIDGVTATLTGTNGLGVAVNLSQVTAGGGAYLFSNLVPGDYKVTFSNLPAGYVFTAQNVGANGFDTVDSDADTTTGMTGTYTLVSGDSNLTVDAGAYLPASLGNFVWNDLNGNGKQELGEPGIDGVTATLTGTNGLGVAVNLSQVTAGGGAYLFSNLVPGDYKVTFSNLPAGYVFTAQNVGANGFDTVDSDADTTTGMTGTYTLVSGDSNLTVDAGAYLPASLGNFVWNDLNGNGKQELGEPGIDGVTATLTGTNGLGVAVNLSQVTAGGGAYLFSNLVPGDYKVTFSNLPAGYVFTAQNVGANGFDTVDSDADTTTGMTGTYTLVSGDSNLTVDAGAYLPASLGNFVWNDLNGNGKQELGEPGIDGVTATLTGTNGLGVAVNLSQVTAGGGAYLFSNLVPGDYKVTFSNLPAGYVFTAQNVGANGFDTVDSDADTTTGMTGTYTLVSGDSNLTVDAGAYLPASLGNFVWNDLNGNGKQELGEPGIDGVTATLTGTNGLGVAVNLSQVTAGGGAYLFSNLVPGDYKVTFSNLPAGYVFTAQDVSSNGFDAIDSDANTTTGVTGNYTLASGDSNLTVDAGVYLPAAIGDYVWLDRNDNGQQDLGEPGINGLTVRLLDASGTTVLFTTTTVDNPYLAGPQDGYYEFRGLKPGSYVVQFSTGAGYDTFAIRDFGPDATDSDANATDGKTIVYTLVSGEFNQTVDAGLKPIDLSLTKTVNNSTPNVGSNVVFTLTVNNASGFSNASGVVVKDVLPAGLTFVSAAFSDTADTFVGNLWTIGNLNAGQSATLTITATVATGGSKTNYAEVNAAGQLDIDSTPNNNSSTEDDDDQVTINPLAQLNAKIDIEKTTNGPSNSNPVAPDYDNEDVPTGAGVPVLASGTAVTWTYKVTNTGNVAFATSDIVIVDDNGTPSVTTDDLSIANGKITFLSVSVGDADNILEPNEVWLYRSISTAQTIVVPGTGLPTTIDFQGGTALDGTDGNVMTFSSGGISVKASAFSRSDSGVWSTAYVGSYGGGLGVTDALDGNGAADTHTVDNMGGSDNYVLLEFSRAVILDSAFLGYVVGDSDVTVWIGSKVDPFNNHATSLSDAYLNSLGFTEVNLTTLTGNRTVDLNSVDYAGNVVIIAAKVDESTNDDRFKIQNIVLKPTAPSTYANKAVITVPGATDFDMSHYKNPGAPAIDIEKTTNGPSNSNPIAPDYDNEDAVNGAGVPVLSPDSAVTWTYRVSNTGNVSFATSDIVIVDDDGTPTVTTDDFSIANGRITFAGVSIGDADNILEPGEVWLYQAVDTVQTILIPGTGPSTTIDFQGNTALDGTDGNIMAFSSGGISVKASAFSRSDSGVWSTAYLGSYGGGLGVTDALDGSGGGDTHTVDNTGGSDNYVLFEFSQSVIVDAATLGYVVGDSDLTVWIGTKSDVFNNHLTLSDTMLSSLGFREVNLGGSAARLADLNASNLAGNVLVIASKVDETTNDDRFKIQNVVLRSTVAGIYENKGVITVPGATDFDLSHYKNPDPTICTHIATTGNTALTGAAGNTLTFGSGNISVKASAFSRMDAAPNTWNTAYLGAYSGGLGVTDGSENGSSNTHTVDNAGGRDNYILFEFSQPVLIDKALLGYVVGDSDITVWIGTRNDPFTNRLTLSDALLSGLGFTEDNTTTLTSARTADINARGVVGNVLVIAAQANDTTPEDYFKISGLNVCTPAKTKFFVVNDSTTTGVADRTYEYTTGGTADENYVLNSANTAPRGAAATAAGDKVWVVDANSRVYVYNNSGGLLGSWTATLPTGARPEGIATNGTDVWIVTSDGNATGRNTTTESMFRFSGATSGTGANRLSGTQSPVSSFALNTSNLNPKDVVTDGSSLWVVNDASSGDRVFRYNLTGGLHGSWMIDAANTSPTGIALDPANVSNLWIVDNGTDRVYQYNSAANLTTGNSARAASTSFALSAGNTNPQGIADPPVWDLSNTASEDVMLNVESNTISQYNAASPTDVNGDGVTSPIDALLVINQLNGRATTGKQYHDVNNDGLASPLDALLVINHLNSVRSSNLSNLSTANTATEQAFAELGESESDAALEDVYADVATQWRKTGGLLQDRRQSVKAK